MKGPCNVGIWQPVAKVIRATCEAHRAKPKRLPHAAADRASTAGEPAGPRGSGPGTGPDAPPGSPQPSALPYGADTPGRCRRTPHPQPPCRRASAAPGTVRPHGVDELSHRDKNFFIVGMKAYGRAPTFLMLTGYEQVRSIADELAGNHEAARIIELNLPETGVCNSRPQTSASGLLPDDAVNDSGGCCEPGSKKVAAASSCCV